MSISTPMPSAEDGTTRKRGPQQPVSDLSDGPLTQQELVEALTELNIGLVEPQTLRPQQARRVASAMWARIQMHRNRAYQLGYLHGRNNHNSVCEDLAAPYVKVDDVPTLFEVEA